VNATSKLCELDEKQLRRFRKIAVFGDLHGDYAALRFGLNIVDPAKDGILFLGDYADRGSSGIEVIEAVDSLMQNNPRNVFALKGNHEDYTKSGTPSFWPRGLIDEVREKRGDWHDYFNSTFKPFVDSLRIAVIVPGETLFVHGGISSKIKSVEDLKHPTRDIERDILWSDPFEGDGEYPNWERYGAGVEFGADVSETVCRLLGVKKIVRSHQPAKALTGPSYSHNCRVVTISSTSVYGGEPFFLSFDPSDFSKVQVIKRGR
jgi:diadenosine tetraphosphatase ApaH/serine/threonine PP2A family protein phosphatase